MEERLEKILPLPLKLFFCFLANSSLEKPVNAKRSYSNHEKLPHHRLWKSKFTDAFVASISGENSEENSVTRVHRRDYFSGWQCVIRHQVWRNWWSDDHNKNYLDEEKGDTKPFLEEIVNGVNEH